MGKVTGFKEFERQDEKYTPVEERVHHYKEFTVPLSDTEIKKQGSRYEYLHTKTLFRHSPDDSWCAAGGGGYCSSGIAYAQFDCQRYALHRRGRHPWCTVFHARSRATGALEGKTSCSASEPNSTAQDANTTV